MDVSWGKMNFDFQVDGHSCQVCDKFMMQLVKFMMLIASFMMVLAKCMMMAAKGMMLAWTMMQI